MDAAPKPSVLIVSHRANEVQLVQRALRRHGYVDVAVLSTPAQTLDHLDQLAPDVLVVDLGLLAADEFGLLHGVRRSVRWGALPVLVLVSRQPVSTIRTAIVEGATGFIGQPFNGGEITYKIEQAAHGLATRAAELADLRDTNAITRSDPAAIGGFHLRSRQSAAT